MSFSMPRDIHRQGEAALRYHVLFFIAAAVAVSLLTLTLLDRRVLNRVASLSAQVSRIGRSRDFRRVSMGGRDELTALSQDIHRMIETLEENEDFLHQVKDNLQAGILTIDPETHTVVDINPYAARIIGLPVQDILGKACRFLCPVEAGMCPVTDLEQELDLTRSDLLTSQGEKIPILKSVSRISRHGRELLLETFVDISEIERVRSERRRLEEKLQQSQKMEAVGTLASGIAHDFNNLLQIISGRVELLLHPACGRDKHRLRLEEIDRAAARGRDLVRHLLTFSRKMEPDPRPIDLNQVVDGSLQFMRRTVSRMVDFTFVPQHNLLPVMGDATQMEQILLNLISNACDAMPEGGSILITTENAAFRSEKFSRYIDLPPGRYVLLSVSDTGTGLDSEVSQHIFEPFFTTKEVGKGSGLGLSTVYGIVKSHNGQISCYSEPGHGTTFKIYLPAIEGSRVGDGTAPVQDDQGLYGRERILLVDDETDILDITNEMLTAYGYSVTTAGNGEQALAIFTRLHKEIDLVVLDLGMPGMGGLACLEKMLGCDPKTRVVVASGYGAHPLARNPGSFGAAAFVGKPYRIEVLLAEIRRVLDTSGPQ